MKKYRTVLQNDFSDCGAACISTICQYYEKNISLGRIKSFTPNISDGLSLRTMDKIASNFCLETKIGKIPQKKIKDLPLPCIISIPGDVIGHYIILFEIKLNKAIIGDPENGTKKVNIDQFFFDDEYICILIRPTKEFKFQKDSTSLYTMLKSLIYGKQKVFLCINILSLLITFLVILGTFYYTTLINIIIPNNLLNYLLGYSAIYIGVYLIKGLIDYFRQKNVIYFSKYIENKQISEIYEHLFKLPMSFFSTNNVGRINSFISSAYSLRDFLSNTATTLALDLVMGIIGAVTLVFLKKELFLILLCQVLITAYVTEYFKEKMLNFDMKLFKEEAELESLFTESLMTIEKVKIFNYKQTMLEDLLKKYYLYSETSAKYGNTISKSVIIVEIINNLSKILILSAGSFLILNKEFSLGQLITFITLSSYFTQPLENIIKIIPSLQTVTVVFNKLLEILEYKTERNCSVYKLSNPESINIEIKDFSYEYYENKKVLEHINMMISENKSTAIIGASGSGKTTLSKSIVRILDDFDGQILVNGICNKDISLESLRKEIVYVSQKPLLFKKSIKENILLKNLNNKECQSEMVRLCKKVGIHDYIMSLPSNYETLISETGASLSGGQQQKICLVQALLLNPKMLILDEATSSLDAISESLIMNLLRKLKITTIVVSHRLQIAKQCDQIIVLDKGAIIEKGKHEMLLNKKGLYSVLWEKQYGKMGDVNIV